MNASVSGALLGSRLPLILQTEAAECGLACLAMVAAWHGGDTGLSALRRRFGLSLRGASLQDLVTTAGHLGLDARALRLEPDELPLLATPCILHWDLCHFVVLKRAGAGSVTIHDPAVGVRRLSRAEALRHFTGVALELSPAAGFAPPPAEPRLRVRQLFGRIAGIKRSLLVLLSMALAIEALGVTTPFFMQWIVDEALVSADRDLLATLAAALLCMLMLRVAIGAMRGATLIAISSTLKVAGRGGLFGHLVRLPTRYFESRHLGDVMSRFGAQETILQALSTDLVEIVLDGLMSAVTLGAMLCYAPGLALLVLGGGMLYAVLRMLSYSSLRNAQAESIVWGARRDSHFLETLRGMKTIKLFNAQAARQTHWINLLVQTVNRQVATQKLGLTFRSVNAALVGVVAVLVVWRGADSVLRNEFSVGMLLAFISYKDQFLSRVSALIDRGLDLCMLRLHAERLADIALTPAETDGVPVWNAQPEDGLGPMAVDLRGLRFRYGAGDPWILDGIDLRIEPGESVAIIGPSGCGKTTMMNIVGGFVQPTQGRVLLDGRPVQGPGPDRGVIFQEYGVFPWLTVRQNIEFGLRLSANRALARDRAEIVTRYMKLMGLADFANHFPKHLSGGMRQRLAIARAYAVRPEFLLMDEPFGALDAQTRSAMQDLLLEVLQSEDKTVMLITHSVEEAIYLSSRIVVVTARPARIRAVIDLPFGYPRSENLHEDPRFGELRSQLRELVMQEYAAQARQAVRLSD
jgi:ATP-binding cassette subfamily B protein RaxB